MGFGYPAQFQMIKESQDTAVDFVLSTMLALPKTYGENLEWVVAECLQKKKLRKLVLCLDDKKPEQIGPDFEIILESNWDPCGVHNGLPMKIFPDNYGIGKNQMVDQP